MPLKQSGYLVHMGLTRYTPKWWDEICSDDKESIIEMSHDNVSIYEEPHGNSISRKILNAVLPEPEKIEYVNW